VRDLAIAIQDIDGHKNDTQFDAGQVEIDHLDTVGEIYAEAVTGMQTAVREQIGEAIGARIEFAEGEAAVLPFERHRIAARNKRKVEEVVQIHARNSSAKVAGLGRERGAPGLCRVGFQNYPGLADSLPNYVTRQLFG